MTAEQLSSEEASRQWKFLLAIENLKPTIEREEARTKNKTKTGSTSLSKTSDSSSGARMRKRSRFSSLPSTSPVVDNNDNGDDDDDDDDDPFNCKSIAVLPTHEIVENSLKAYVNEWKQLDDRKVNKVAKVSTKDTQLNDNDNGNNDDDDDGKISVNTANTTKTTKTKPHAGGWKWMDGKRLSLPERFNYVGGGGPLDNDDDDDNGGDRVISLDNPTQTLSYHKELQKLFNSIPTYRQLEDMARSDNQVNNTLRMYQETHAVKSGVADYHALARLRMPDRHGLPPYYAQEQSSSKQRLTTTTTTSNNNNINSNSQTDTTSTITFEIWKRQPKRHHTSDCHRMVLEFRASQTLWDLHMILSQMAEDGLWNAVVAAGAGAAGAAGDNNTCTGNDDTDIAITNSNTNSSQNIGNDEDENDSDGGEDTHQREQPSGCFFIENNFYKTGSVDYTKPIMDWIDNNSNKPNPIRRGYLGISSSKPITNDKIMKDTKLSQVPFRLNIRYYHACHGDVETAVMLVDRKLIHFNRDENESDNKVVYPIIHDIWTAPRVPAVPLCDACQMYQAVFVTSTDCNTTDGGPRALCHECCTDLKLLEKEKQSVKLIIPWRNQVDLSNRIAREHDKNF